MQRKTRKKLDQFVSEKESQRRKDCKIKEKKEIKTREENEGEFYRVARVEGAITICFR